MAVNLAGFEFENVTVAVPIMEEVTVPSIPTMLISVLIVVSTNGPAPVTTAVVVVFGPVAVVGFGPVVVGFGFVVVAAAVTVISPLINQRGGFPPLFFM